METQSENPPQASRPPLQIGLSKLLQLVTVAALWCVAGVARENVVSGMAYALVTTVVTWVVVGRWAVSLSPRACRRVLAATTALLVAGGMGVTALVDTMDYLPFAFLLSALPIVLSVELVSNSQSGPQLDIAVAVACGLLMLTAVYFVWRLVFWAWDRLSMRPGPRWLGWSFSILLVVLALPLTVIISYGCYTFDGHGHGMGTKHVWLHCLLHVGMLAAAVAIIGLLQRHALGAIGRPPNWLKLLTLGYLCLYAVLAQVALLPINFYIP